MRVFSCCLAVARVDYGNALVTDDGWVHKIVNLRVAFVRLQLCGPRSYADRVPHACDAQTRPRGYAVACHMHDTRRPAAKKAR